MTQDTIKGVSKETENEIKKMQLEVSQVTRTTSVLNPNQIQKLWNSTPSRFTYKRPAKGGGNWDYVKTSYVRKVLDSVFGFNWSFEVETSLSEAFEVAKITKACVVKGVLTAKVKDNGVWIELTKTQFGRAEVKFKTETAKSENGQIIYEDQYINGKSVRKPKRVPTTEPLDFGNDMKAATSDALKKCASLFGIAADIYEASEFTPIDIIGSDEASERTKATKKALKNTKQTIKRRAEKVEKADAK